MTTSIIITEADGKIIVAIQSNKPLPAKVKHGAKVEDVTQYLAFTAIDSIAGEVEKINKQLKELRDKKGKKHANNH